MIRGIDTIPSTSTVIEDKLLEPFFIVKAVNGGFTVYENITKNGKEALMTIGYYSNFNGCLQSIIREQLNHGDKTHYKSLQEYFDKYSEISENILNLIK